MQLHGGHNQGVLCFSSFNPHPTRRPGATVGARHYGSGLAQFQSSPDPEAGCNKALLLAYDSLFDVSILTRPGGRVQR